MRESLPVSEIERILLADPHVVAIHPAEEWKIPEIDASLWNTGAEKGSDVVQGIVQYLNEKYIEDDFGNNHTARRKWRMQLWKHPGLNEYYQSQALKYGRLQAVELQLFMIEEVYSGGKREELAQKIKEVRGLLFKGKGTYNSLTSSGKIDYIKSIKAKLYDVLICLSQQTPRS